MISQVRDDIAERTRKLANDYKRVLSDEGEGEEMHLGEV